MPPFVGPRQWWKVLISLWKSHCCRGTLCLRVGKVSKMAGTSGFFARRAWSSLLSVLIFSILASRVLLEGVSFVVLRFFIDWNHFMCQCVFFEHMKNSRSSEFRPSSVSTSHRPFVPNNSSTYCFAVINHIYFEQIPNPFPLL